MSSKLELIGINNRNGLIIPNLYKQDWLAPGNITNNYSVLHTRALSDNKTPIYGKGTGGFLDTSNYLAGGEYDKNGNVRYAGSGRLNAIGINTAQWSYGPTTPYGVNNTRALSDNKTPVYGKGTSKFLDTENGGGDYDINGNINYLGSGRLNAIGINTAQWSYGPTTPYGVNNTRALSDSDTPVYGKGTSKFLDTENGGGDYDINGNIRYAGSGRLPLMNYNFSIWSFGPNSKYSMSHPHALSPVKTPSAADALSLGDNHGKGTNDGMGLDGTLAGHTNYKSGSWDDIISRNRNIEKFGNIYWVNVKQPSDAKNWYSMSHPNALADNDSKGKGTNDGIGLDGVYAAHTNYKGGSDYDINGNQKIWPGSGRIASNSTNVNYVNPTIMVNKNSIVTISGNKSFGYGYGPQQGYDSAYPKCADSGNKINVGKVTSTNW